MHDNDPKHTAVVCKNYLKSQAEDNILEIMTWPPQSPDLNPIEKLWDELDRRVRQRAPTSKQQLWSMLESEWQNIPPETLQQLTNRMPRVVQAVLNAKGGFFDERKVYLFFLSSTLYYIPSTYVQE